MTDVPDWVAMTDGEELIWQDKPALLPYAVSLVSEVILIVLGLGIWLTSGFASLTGITSAPTVPVLAVSVWSLIGALAIAWGGLGILNTGFTWWSKHYVITTEEIYKKSGLISRSIKNTRLTEVQNTTFSQSILGRLGSYGNVGIYTAGTAGREIGFENVPSPETVVHTIAEERSPD